jgi:hypothetical protein
MTPPFRRAALVIAGVVLLALVGFLIARTWHANLLATIGAQPSVAILNDSEREMRDVHLVLSGTDFLTNEYRFPVLEPGGKLTVAVHAHQEFMMERLKFFVGDDEYETGNGPSMGPGERATIVVRQGMEVGWRFADGATMVIRHAEPR